MGLSEEGEGVGPHCQALDVKKTKFYTKWLGKSRRSADKAATSIDGHEQGQWDELLDMGLAGQTMMDQRRNGGNLN